MPPKSLNVTGAGIRSLRQRLASGKLPQLTKEMFVNTKNVWRNAADAFIRAAVTQVLVETGMSAASFFPLSRAIKKSGAKTAIQSRISGGLKKTSLKGIKTFPSGKLISGRRSARSGNKAGKDAFIFTTGSQAKPVLTFQFVTVVFQFAFHEPSEKAIETGFNAFKEVINRDLSKIYLFTIRKHLGLKIRTKRITGSNTGFTDVSGL